MKHLIIIGARGWGRECLWMAQNTKENNRIYDIKGFLDSDSHALDGLAGDFPPIIGSVENYKIEPDDVFLVAMGDPKWRKYYADIIEERGGKFISIISSLAIISPNAKIAHGCTIGANVIISDNVQIGKHVMIHGFSTLGHDCVVDDFASLGSYVFLGGNSHVGKMSVMHPKSMIIARKSIGDNVIVGAASVVMRNIKDGLHVLGNPAVKIEY